MQNDLWTEKAAMEKGGIFLHKIIVRKCDERLVSQILKDNY